MERGTAPVQQVLERRLSVTAEMDNTTAQDESVYCRQSHTSLFTADELQLCQEEYKGHICGASAPHDARDLRRSYSEGFILSLEAAWARRNWTDALKLC